MSQNRLVEDEEKIMNEKIKNLINLKEKFLCVSIVKTKLIIN